MTFEVNTVTARFLNGPMAGQTWALPYRHPYVEVDVAAPFDYWAVSDTASITVERLRYELVCFPDGTVEAWDGAHLYWLGD